MTKKLLTLLLVGVLIFALSSCSADNGESNSDIETEYEAVNVFKGVTLAVKKGSITPEGLTLVFHNNQDKEHIYSSFYCIERKNGDKWTKIAYVTEENVGWDDMAYILPANQSVEEAVDWEWLYGSLNAGEYRIIKEVFDYEAAGEYKTYYLAAEFVIY